MLLQAKKVMSAPQFQDKEESWSKSPNQDERQQKIVCSGKRVNDVMLTSRSMRFQRFDSGGTFKIQQWKAASHTFI